MDPVYARYPFVSEARAAVEATDVDLATLVRNRDSAVLDRAVDRIESAITDGRVSDPISDHEVELLSYPMARVLVSVINEPVLTDRYALAEARRAQELLDADRETAALQSTAHRTLDRETILDELDLIDRLIDTPDGPMIAVASYLQLVTELRDPTWRLIKRQLADGMVSITEDELEVLIREAIRHRVATDLPLRVPEDIADALATRVDYLVDMLAEVQLPSTIDVVSPPHFPSCMVSLLDRYRTGDEMDAIARFTLVSFLCSIGLDEDELLAFLEVTSPSEAEALRYQYRHVHASANATAYPPPTCRTLAAAGVCREDSPGCAGAPHPLIGYKRRLAAATDISDWRMSSVNTE